MGFNIFSRGPVKCLARSRCVSKDWCSNVDDRDLVIIHDKRGVEEPTPILYHDNIFHERICFHAIESKQSETTHYALEPKEGPFLEYLRKEPLSRSSIKIQVLDVRVLLKEDAPPYKPDLVKKNLCTMVHVLGTNSWREIPQVPSYPIGEAVFANGCLHWLASYSDIKSVDGGREVIWFDVNKDEFGLIERPKGICVLWNYSWTHHRLVNVNGEVGYVCARTMEFSLLNHKKEWVPHCRFKREIVPSGFNADVIGCWNKDGDILIKSIGVYPGHVFYVYNLKSGVLHKTSLAGSGTCPGIKWLI
uniref:F-box associated beta-propeller type 3 domain-containing protein n=1 Tax=Tanacetum cinerariifolium TaxID=118510 RepID=A0A6L2L5M8_TANCI|nr:hypothetical protein [Tanacetum cinerariifolium]